MRKNILKGSLVGFILLFTVSPIYANMMIPVISSALPDMCIALILITAIESYYFVRKFKSNPLRLIKTVFVVNLVTTMIGRLLLGIIPNEYGFLFLVLFWPLLGLFFVATCFVEYQIAKRMLRDLSPKDIERSVLSSNLMSYSFLLIVFLWRLFIPSFGKF